MDEQASMGGRHDVVIVGGGSAGAVLASRISEDPGRKVLLLEAGCDYPDGDFPPDLLAGSHASVEPYRTWGYASVPDSNGHPIAAWAGKVIGGGSSINGAVSRRARPADFARWASRGLPEWGWDQVAETFRSLENTGDGDERWRGRSGPWPVRQTAVEGLTRSVRAYVDAAVAAGYAPVTDFNDPGHGGGAGAEATNILDGVRCNTAMAYLTQEVRARPNLVVTADTMVDRVIFDGDRATAVRLGDGTLVSAGEVILSAGTFGSAALLLRSGIGPADHLDALGVEVVSDLPVGLHLQDQPMVVLAFPLKPDASVASFDGSGVVWTSSAGTSAGELDLQLSVSAQPGYGPDGRPMHVLSVWACLVLPRSTGKVRLKGTDPRVTPWIDFGLLSDPNDRWRLRELVVLARRLARDRRVAPLLLEAGPPSADLPAEQLDAYIATGLTTFLHATSTAPMGGPDDDRAVVDAWGRVRGTAGLRVVDASIFPCAVSVPINLTVIMVAERIAADVRDAGRVRG